MRIFKVVALLVFVWAGAAQAITLDAKAVARFDASYARCEAQFPDMRGHGDEAYLSLWRVKTDAKTSAQFAALRRSAEYQKEKARRNSPKASARSASASAANTLENQCQALWAETRRTTSASSPKP